MREFKITESRVVISGNNQNQVLETFNNMKVDVECNKTTPVIESYRLHGYYEILRKMTSNKVPRRTQIVELEKKQGQMWNQRPLKCWEPL